MSDTTLFIIGFVLGCISWILLPFFLKVQKQCFLLKKSESPVEFAISAPQNTGKHNSTYVPSSPPYVPLSPPLQPMGPLPSGLPTTHVVDIEAPRVEEEIQPEECTQAYSFPRHIHPLPELLIHEDDPPFSSPPLQTLGHLLCSSPNAPSTLPSPPLEPKPTEIEICVSSPDLQVQSHSFGQQQWKQDQARRLSGKHWHGMVHPLPEYPTTKDLTSCILSYTYGY